MKISCLKLCCGVLLHSPFKYGTDKKSKHQFLERINAKINSAATYSENAQTTAQHRYIANYCRLATMGICVFD